MTASSYLRLDTRGAASDKTLSASSYGAACLVARALGCEQYLDLRGSN